ncbi:hypothetical protein H257_17429 [Aphanomyces astaci]|uniref:Tc1-like transposase DDE domain-containing protein n=1 Tax=Aphanomyces astaci TaxID=112090 RepID=W4FEU0_APHAT|nr:hypothetical protein H257_17429 [Aphanomyces astaci]ETV66012.1 hypothetical protein H257_17429 [Aphanomyces astaci]|eukprot:XP_009844531.1 hypothetical protein H257_17429 [Aphanomyces astaci]
MTSLDMRWRCAVLVQVYSIDVNTVVVLLGLSHRSVTRFNTQFMKTGTVDAMRNTSPCFYIEELQDALKLEFPTLANVYKATICRALMHDLGLTRKVLEKRAREAAVFELHDYYRRLRPLYSNPDQLVFVDETSKDGRDALRKQRVSGRAVQKLAY